MKTVFNAKVGMYSEDFDTMEAAKAAVVAQGQGYGHVVTFVCYPGESDRSCAMESLKDGEWVGVDISGG